MEVNKVKYQRLINGPLDGYGDGQTFHSLLLYMFGYFFYEHG